jgi:hypothetical protein
MWNLFLREPLQEQVNVGIADLERVKMELEEVFCHGGCKLRYNFRFDLVPAPLGIIATRLFNPACSINSAIVLSGQSPDDLPVIYHAGRLAGRLAGSSYQAKYFSVFSLPDFTSASFLSLLRSKSVVRTPRVSM